uniref:Uncharacterized protein n=1 Tax=Anopheles coluzzii TaxID=1518534 RepID=A0A8W7P1W2_ANOCL
MFRPLVYTKDLAPSAPIMCEVVRTREKTRQRRRKDDRAQGAVPSLCIVYMCVHRPIASSHPFISGALRWEMIWPQPVQVSALSAECLGGVDRRNMVPGRGVTEEASCSIFEVKPRENKVPESSFLNGTGFGNPLPGFDKGVAHRPTKPVGIL